jgi:hypothetical protein
MKKLLLLSIAVISTVFAKVEIENIGSEPVIAEVNIPGAAGNIWSNTIFPGESKVIFSSKKHKEYADKDLYLDIKSKGGQLIAGRSIPNPQELHNAYFYVAAKQQKMPLYGFRGQGIGQATINIIGGIYESNTGKFTNKKNFNEAATGKIPKRPGKKEVQQLPDLFQEKGKEVILIPASPEHD